MDTFLLELLCVSERAATIARLCRAEKTLFELLVEEKTGDGRNKRFHRDFKTLADVLIQETVRHYIGRKYPSLCSKINGEESAEFTNSLGESITVRVCASECDTVALLGRVMDGNKAAASMLASAVHKDLPLPHIPQEQLKAVQSVSLCPSQLGIWIDPIDGTNEYIKGDSTEPFPCGIFTVGLQCVTVLIGAFDISSGEPVVGTVNQPFWRKNAGGWAGRQLWGVCAQGKSVSSLPSPTGPGSGLLRGRRVVMSSSDSEQVKWVLREAGCEVVCAAGCGYKLLCVIDGHADAYLHSKSSTFKWDTCSPQGILRSLGGGIVSWEAVVASGEMKALCYHRPDSPALSVGQQWRNDGGFLAYCSIQTAQAIAKLVKGDG